MANKKDPDGAIHKWGEPEGVTDYMQKTPGEKKKAKTIKVGEDTVRSDTSHYALVKKRKVVATGTKEEMLDLHREDGGRVWVSTKEVGDIVEMKSFKEAKYSVDVDGLPRFYMDADSPAEIKKKLRTLLRKASSIDSVERSNDAKIKTDLRQRIKGGDTDKRNVDEANLRKMDHDEFMAYGDSNPRGRADPSWNAERKRRYRNAQAKNYRKMKKEEVESADGCFPAGSTVFVKYAINGEEFIDQKWIENIEVGDIVLGYSGWNTVTTVHTLPLEERNFVTYNFAGRLLDWTGQIKCTDYHPIMFDRDNIWDMPNHEYAWCSMNPTKSNEMHAGLNVTQPLVGDFVVTYTLDERCANNPIHHTCLQSITETTETIPVYNFETDGDHTYCVNTVFVHNKTGSNVMDEARYSRGGRSGMEPTLKMMKAADALAAYGKKSGGLDKDDFMMASMIMRDGDMAGFEKFVKQMDTDPRDGIMVILKKHGLLRGGKMVKEEKKGLWYNIHKKRKEGRKMREPGSKGAPTDQDFKDAQEAKAHQFTTGSDKGMKGGHRAKMTGPKGVSYLGSKSYKTAKHAKGEADAYHHGYFNTPSKANNDKAAMNRVHDYRKANAKHMHEAVYDEGTDFAAHRAKPKLTPSDASKMKKVAAMMARERQKKDKRNEETKMDEGMVRAVSTAKRMAGNMTGAVKKIDKMKPKKKGGDFSDNPRVQKKLQKYNEGLESWSSFLESSCGGGSKRMKKEAELSPAQKKHLDVDNDNDIDSADFKKLRNKKK